MKYQKQNKHKQHTKALVMASLEWSLVAFGLAAGMALMHMLVLSSLS